MTSVRDATLDVLRSRGMTTIFSNPGSTEVSFLKDLPEDFEFILGLHEGSVVGLATGYALGRDAPAFCLLHTTPGFGHAVSAIATARVNRAPLVIAVGQQDRRHLATEPFLAGHLMGLAGDYPVWMHHPVRAQDVPGAINRAWHEAMTHRGAAIVIVPMDDWDVVAQEIEEHEITGPAALLRPAAIDETSVSALAEMIDSASSPAIVSGAGADTPAAWAALVALAERLECPVWQESFGGRAGFPQDHRLFAGFLPSDRPRLRAALSGHDVVLAVGAPIFRQYPYAPGPYVEPGTRMAIVTDDPDEAHRSPADLALLADPAAICSAVAQRVRVRESGSRAIPARATAPPAPGDGEPMRAGHVLGALAERLAPNTILVEECPSNRPELHALLPARDNLGYLGVAMGGLGFGMPAAAGLRLGCPDRPVVAVLGDGSSMYAIQSLWSAARYGAGALFVVLANGGYAIMDLLAARTGSPGPWPSFKIDYVGLATSLGCDARRITTHAELLAELDETVPGLARRAEPLLLEVCVTPNTTFDP